MTMPRIFVAALATETNTFSPIHVDVRAFEASLLARPGEHPDTPTLCTAIIPVGREVAKAMGWTLVEGTAAWADPAGLVARETYEGLRDEILGQLSAAMPVDAVVLGLHGAMVATGYLDPEGDFLTRVRDLVGPEVPILATFDPHSHLTEKRVAAADVLIAFKEFPHTDFVDRAKDVWRILGGILTEGVRPVMAVHDCAMIDVFPTSRQPMRDFVDRMMARESEPGILSLSLVHGFMAGDVPEMGTKVLAVTDGDIDLARTVAADLGAQVWQMRGTTRSPEVSVDAALDRIVEGPGPVVVADMWDNPGGGTAGDATVLLAAALERGMSGVAFGTIWDPIAVQICHAAGEGAELQLRFGAKSAPGTGAPIDAVVEVVRNQVDAWQYFGDSHVPIGDASVIRVNGIEVILNSTRAQCFDTSLFSNMGINPEARAGLVVKSTNHFHASFAKIASEIVYCSAGQPYPNDPRVTDYKHARRDIWPINEER